MPPGSRLKSPVSIACNWRMLSLVAEATASRVMPLVARQFLRPRISESIGEALNSDCNIFIFCYTAVGDQFAEFRYRNWTGNYNLRSSFSEPGADGVGHI